MHNKQSKATRLNAIILLFLLIICNHLNAQKNQSVLKGKIVGVDGNPAMNIDVELKN